MASSPKARGWQASLSWPTSTPSARTPSRQNRMRIQNSTSLNGGLPVPLGITSLCVSAAITYTSDRLSGRHISMTALGISGSGFRDLRKI